MTASATWANVTTSLGVTSTAVSVAKPTVTTGDELLVIVTVYDSSTVTCTTPTGCTALTPVRESTSEISNIFAFYAPEGSVSNPITANLSAYQYYDAIVIPVTSVGATPFDTSAPSNGRSATQNLPGITTGHDDEYLIGVRVGYNTTVSSGPSGWTQQANYDTVIYLYDRNVATAGAVASANLTATGTEGWTSLVVAFQSAAAAGFDVPDLHPRPQLAVYRM